MISLNFDHKCNTVKLQIFTEDLCHVFSGYIKTNKNKLHKNYVF